MKGYKVSFNIFAENQEEADAVSRLLGEFVDGYAKLGVAVCASKLLPLPELLENNPFLKGRITNYLRDGK